MKKIAAIIKKDLKRYFNDPRILVSLFLPGIIIFVIYSIIGGIIGDMTDLSDEEYTVYTLNLPEPLASLFTPEGMNVHLVDAAERGLGDEAVLEEIHEGKVSVYVKFDENFKENLNLWLLGQLAQNSPTDGAQTPTDPSQTPADNTPQDPADEPSGQPTPAPAVPQVKIYYDSSDVGSLALYNVYASALDALEDGLSNLFDVNGGNETFDLAEVETAADIMSAFMPMIMIVFLWSGAMMISAESIAGEKERGTMATLLATPIQRSHIALAKAVSLSVPALISSMCSFAGLMLSLPGLMPGVTLAHYGFGEYAALFLLNAVTTVMFTVILTVVSTLSRSVKEASGYSSALMVGIMVVGMANSIAPETASPAAFLIPVFGAGRCYSQIMSLSFNPLSFAITIAASLFYIAVGVFALSRLFSNERVMFGK